MMKDMKKLKKILVAVAALACVATAQAQDSSSSSVMRRGRRDAKQEQTNQQVTPRMQQRLQEQPKSDADMSWMKVIYRSLDLTKDPNAPLYFPEQPVDGAENLIHIIMRLLADGQLPVYEYLDGREVFNEQNLVKARDVLDRFSIYYQEAKGSNEKHPRFTIDDSDMPTTEVLSYFIIERWEFDNRSNRMKTRIEAICPVMHRADDFGMESVKYPMFWVKYDDLRPYLSTQNIFISDSNNMPSCTYDDYFRLGLYEGDIYKTRNLRNRSMAQLYPDPDDMKRAQDSIQNQLDNFEKKLWVPTLEELTEMREARELAEMEAEESDTTAMKTAPVEKKRRATTSRRGKKTEAKPAKAKKKPKKADAPKTKSAATRSVRNHKR